jgi:hypothetical protein
MGMAIPRHAALAAGFVVLLAAAPARASFHLWQIEEVFSNADGTIQYIEFHTTSTFNQHVLLGRVLRSNQGLTVLDSYTFPSNLGTPTQNKFFLVATPAFAAAAGIEPDYTLPAPGFLHLDATDTVLMVGSLTTPFSFDPSALPTDGVHSLDASAGFPAVVADNTPTNFAGDTGHLVPEPEATALGVTAAGALGLFARRNRAFFARPSA